MEGTESQRPTFLKVLCVLSFVGGGYVVLNGLIGALSAGTVNFTEEDAETIRAVYENLFTVELTEEMINFIFESQVHAQNIGATNFLLGALSVLGVYMMYKLKRSGFYIYLGAQTALLFSTFFFFDVSLISVATFAFNFIFYLAFIIMYGVNFKYLH